MALNFHIQAQDALPIYRQIVEQVRRWVASGQALDGDELPSVRALAQQHAINPMTVSKAYSLLEAEGLVERRRGMGMYIKVRQQAPQAIELLRPTLEAAALQAQQLGLSADEALTLFAQCLTPPQS
ncbi:GntR family transcriptional regulator [Roseateles sp. BYS180W]|uniref:GntR family transcriptional regulator n=1 Tax=Roseateles rivi TaxID=3299028 RepID=A0ABW7FSB1_9BURK